MGQQKKQKLGMGPGGGIPMGPGRQRGEILGNPGRIPSPPEVNFDKMLIALKGPRGREKLHMGWEGHQRQSEGKVGYPSPPDHQGKARDHRPKNPVGSTPSKAPH
ncbi:unnamed protein product [Sphagnum balticum]